MTIEFKVRQSVRHIITRYESNQNGSSVSTVCELDNWERAIDLAKFLANHTPGAIYTEYRTGTQTEAPVAQKPVTQKPRQTATRKYIVAHDDIYKIMDCLKVYVDRPNWKLKITKSELARDSNGDTWNVHFSLSYTARGANSTDLSRSIKENLEPITIINPTALSQVGDCSTISGPYEFYVDLVKSSNPTR